MSLQKNLCFLTDHFYLALSQPKNLGLFQLNVFADSNFKLDEYGRKGSKWVENPVEKGEIAHNKQFLLFSQCFQNACTADSKNKRAMMALYRSTG